LAVLFPAHFGTVDQFAVNALAKIPELPERDLIAAMNRVSLKLSEGRLVIHHRKHVRLVLTLNSAHPTVIALLAHALDSHFMVVYPFGEGFPELNVYGLDRFKVF
jgi:hypothetical protein